MQVCNKKVMEVMVSVRTVVKVMLRGKVKVFRKLGKVLKVIVILFSYCNWFVRAVVKRMVKTRGFVKMIVIVVCLQHFLRAVQILRHSFWGL